MSRKWRNEVEDVLAAEGACAIRWEDTGGGHVRVRGRVGRRHFALTVSATPSDRRTLLNIRGDLRRIIKGIKAL